MIQILRSRELMMVSEKNPDIRDILIDVTDYFSFHPNATAKVEKKEQA